MIFFVTIWIESFCTSGNRIGQTMAQMDSSIPKSNAFNFPEERKKKKDKNFFSQGFFRYTKPMASFVCLHIASDNSWRSLSNAFLGVIHILRMHFQGALCVRVRIIWDGHKIWKKSSTKNWVASNFKWKIFFKFCGLLRISELYQCWFFQWDSFQIVDEQFLISQIVCYPFFGSVKSQLFGLIM